MNHDDCSRFGNAILAQFGRADVIRHSLGEFDGDWNKLNDLVDQWWGAYKLWEAQDTLADAFKEQRLTVKGTTTMNQNIEAREMPEDPNQRYKKDAKWGNTSPFPGSLIVKTNASIMARLNPDVFVPPKGLASNKTEKGYHDLSGLLLNPKADISTQQYKGRNGIEPNQVYVFMPLAYALDQAVFHNINTMAKAQQGNGMTQQDFYNKVRGIRSKMTRIKLLAEHDMATSFVMVGRTKSGQPKFKYTLIEKTDVSRRDVESKTVPADTLHAGVTQLLLDAALKDAFPDDKPAHSSAASVLKEVLFPLFSLPKLPPEEFMSRYEEQFSKREHKNKLAKVKDLDRCKRLILEKAAPKTRQIKTTPGIFQARQLAAVNYQALVLGEMMRYAEVTIAYRQHAGAFPKFATFDNQHSRWVVGTVDGDNAWTAKQPQETFADRPV